MVGAGFSRQAESLGIPNARLPLWSELRRSLAATLNLPSDNAAPVLEVAQQFQERFGRPALDNAISDLIPDAAFGPGEAHRRLLALPWADVFTTNYDTLLERAAVNIIERRYETILVAGDLPQRASPRIVKLHGSLPSHRPFVISSDDYHRYPEDQAPFVNLVRQAAMETVLVLLGFSGRDPNFEEWMDWVRKKLGKQALPIYLCGVLELAPAEVAALAERNIVALNLGELFTKQDYPQRDERHAAATGWFLKVMADGKPARAGEWAPTSKAVLKALKPPGPPPGHFTPFSESVPASDDLMTPEKIRSVINVWKEQRLQYPGWIVVPNPPRWRIWNYTERWRQPLFDVLDSLPLPDQFRLLCELCWRIELCLASVWTNEMERIAKVLERCNPFPGVLDLPNAESHLPGVTDTDFAEGWIDLVLTILRVAREDLEVEIHRRWSARLEALLPVWPQLGAKLFAEQVYWAQAQLDLDEIDKKLVRWETNDRSLPGRARMVAVKAELGRSDEAYTQATVVLQELRSKLGALHYPLVLLSLESWLIDLIEMVKEKPWWRPPEIRERLAELRRAECDPDEIVNELKSDLKDFELPLHDRSEGPDFDLGYSEDDEKPVRRELDDILPAFRVLRLVEVAPCAWHTPHFAYLSREAAAAAIWLQTISPFRALSVIVRTHDEKALSHFMDRASVAMLPLDQVDRMWTILHRLSTQVLMRIPDSFRTASSDTNCQMGAMTLQLLSRLAFRLQPPQLAQLVDLVSRWLHSPRAPRVWVFDKAMSVLIERVIFVIPADQLPAVAIRFLASGVFEDKGDGEISRGRWPEIADLLFKREDWPSTTPALPAGLMDRLLHHARSDDSEGRHRAVYRILFLSEQKWLSESERAASAVAIWSRLDAGNGRPFHVRLTPAGQALLPGAEEHGQVAKFRQQLESGDFPSILMPDGKSMQTTILREIADWVNDVRRHFGIFYRPAPRFILEPESARRLLAGTIRWWETNVATLHEIATGKRGRPVITADSAHAVAHRFTSMIGECVLPVLKEDSSSHAIAIAWLSSVEKAGFSRHLALTGLLAIGKADPESTATSMSRLLLAQSRREINDGSWLVASWYRAQKRGIISAAPPQWLLDVLANRVSWRAEPSLDLSCSWLANLVREHGEQVSPGARALLLQSLEVLLATTDFEQWWRQSSGKVSARKEAHRLMTLRTKVTGVASALHRAAVQRGETPDPVLEKWRTLALENRLPEIRRAWDEST